MDTGPQDAKHFVQQGKTALADNRAADARMAFEQALGVDGDCLEAHHALVRIKFPGEIYYDVLSRIHHFLRPKTYLEIGVASGASMKRVLPGTKCIGIDPTPNPDPGLAHAQLFALRSDAFFAVHDLRALLGGPLDMGLIDGMHLFENTLEDFINLERYAAPGGTVLIHDCLPFDEATSTRERKTTFWTGDVWRIFPVLAHFRPDLSLTVVGCAPSGLGIVRGLDPASDVLAKRQKDVLAFKVTHDLAAHGIKVIANDWAEISRVLSQ
jgi:hypothetical protein